METKSGVKLEETLLPALMQCFGIIFLGYILGKIKILRHYEAKGLSIFVQYLALPALIFSTISTMPFSEMKWEFVASVFVTKSCIFFCVALFSILLTQPLDLGKAGLYAIAATQSNDFALGYPLLMSLYQSTHPEFVMYLYIIALIQLLLLNGIGFFLVEIEKNKYDSDWNCCRILHIVKEIFKNPVVLMTILGLIWNVTFGQKVLPVLDTILKAFSAAFPATALLLLGYTMTINNKSSSHITISVALIVLVKNLILPIILQKMTICLLQNSSIKEIQSFSSFGFLYGTIPTAPTVYVFATHYESCVNVIAKTIVSSTLLSAPLMFSSASVISVSQSGIENVAFLLSQTISYLSLINCICCIWLLLVFCMGKRWKNLSFGITIYLVFAQFLTAVGGLMLFSSPRKPMASFYIQYILTSGSIYATRMCSLLLAGLLLIIRVRSLCFILQMKKKFNFISIIICLFLPYLIASTLIVDKNGSYGPTIYHLGFIQTVSTFVITFFCLFGTVLCLVLQRMFFKKSPQTQPQNERLERVHDPKFKSCCSTKDIDAQNMCCDIEDIGENVEQSDSNTNETLSNDLEDHICNSNFPCRFECALQLSSYISENQAIGTGINDDNEHFLQHIGLLIALCVSMTLSLSVCLWKLVMEEVNGVFIELEFLEAIVNYSLGIFYFIMFGFDENLMDIFYTKFKFFWGKLLPNREISNQKCISEQFLSIYYEKCMRDIAQTRLINGIEYLNVFERNSLIQWILKENLVSTSEEADLFIQNLFVDNVIEQIYESNNFAKKLNILRFTNLYINDEI